MICFGRRSRTIIIAAAITVVGSWRAWGSNEEFVTPHRVKLLPVVLVPADQKPPTRTQRSLWLRHLKWTQEFFRERLDGRDSLEFARQSPDVVQLKRPLAYYTALKEAEPALHWTAELLDHYQVSRFRCPYVFCCLVMNPAERWPIGGGRTINGGVNRGGGLLVMSSFAIDRLPNVQSTLRHEVAHTFGLPHVDVYGIEMTESRSIMAYNPMNRTSGFRDSPTPAELIPEDRRLLALADAVFPELTFDRKRDLPVDYQLFPRVITLGAMEIPGHADYGPVLSTTSGEDNGSKVTNVNRREILPSTGPGVTFRAPWMWASQKQPDGQVVLDLEFPGEVTLTQFLIHSGHSGKYNQASGIRVEVPGDAGAYREVTQQSINSADASISFSGTTSQRWRLTFSTGPSEKLCLRGLQYFSGDNHLFPPPVPYDWREKIGVDVAAFPASGERN